MKNTYLKLKTQFLLLVPSSYRAEGKLVTKYAISGSIAAFSQISIFYLLIRMFGKELYLLASTTAFVIAVSISFLLQKFWTFGDADVRAIRKQFPIFFSIGVGNLLLNGAFMYILVELLNNPHVVAQAVTMGALAVGSFLLNRTITFNVRKDEGADYNRNIPS